MLFRDLNRVVTSKYLTWTGKTGAKPSCLFSLNIITETQRGLEQLRVFPLHTSLDNLNTGTKSISIQSALLAINKSTEETRYNSLLLPSQIPAAKAGFGPADNKSPIFFSF